MPRLVGKFRFRVALRHLALGAMGFAVAALFGPAEAGTRKDDQTLAEIQLGKSARAARLAAEAEATADMPIVITPASTTPDVEPIDPGVTTTSQKQTQEAAATAGDGVDDFASVNPDVPIDDIQVPSDLTEEIDDPLEPVNRLFFGLNEGLDFLMLRPVAIVYRNVIPKPVRIGVGNALRNAASPVILANDILQGADGKRVEATMVRFMLNSTIGVGGLIDVGSYVGLDFHREDFGQTLATWGIGPGPYMVAPILGPGNPRDFVGVVVDTAINPMTWILADEKFWIRMAPSAAEMISTREVALDDVDALRKTSPDFYVTVRQLYSEKRKTDIANGDVGLDPIPGTTSLSVYFNDTDRQSVLIAANIEALRVMVTRRFFLTATMLAATGLATSANAASAAESYVNTVGNSVLAAARANSVAKFRSLLRANADIPAIALFSLGAYRKSLTKNVQAEYFRLVEDYIANVFTSHASQLAGDSLEVIGSQSTGDSVLVKTKVSYSGGKTVLVTWRIVKRGGGYKIFDVNVDGIWLATTQKTNFVTVLKKNKGDINALLAYLRA